MTLTVFLAFLANHLWQSTLFAVAAGLLTLTLRKSQARTRYWIWWIASLKFFVPFSLLVTMGSLFSWRTAPEVATEPSASAFVIDQVAQPFATGESWTTFSGAVSPATDVSISELPALAVAVWLLGSGLMLL